MFPECFRITLILAVEVIVYSRYTFFLENFNNFKTRNNFTFWAHFVMATAYSLGISSKDMSNWKILYFLEVITQLSTPSTVRFFYLLGLKKKAFSALRDCLLSVANIQKTENDITKKIMGEKISVSIDFQWTSFLRQHRVASSKFLRLIFKIASNLHFYITPKTKKMAIY